MRVINFCHFRTCLVFLQIAQRAMCQICLNFELPSVRTDTRRNMTASTYTFRCHTFPGCILQLYGIFIYNISVQKWLRFSFNYFQAPSKTRFFLQNVYCLFLDLVKTPAQTYSRQRNEYGSIHNW